MASIKMDMWMARFQRAKDLQAEHAKERKDAIRLFTSTFFGKAADDGNEDQEVNFVYEFVDVILSAIYARNPHIFTTTDTTKWLSFSDTMEKVINYYWREKKVKGKMKKAIKDGLLQPPGWLSIGFKMPLEGEKDAQDLEREFPELKADNKKTEESQGNLDETVKRGDVSINHISSWDVLWPDGYNDIRTAPYLFVLERTNLEDVQNNTMLKKTRFDIRQFVGVSSTTEKPTSFTMQANPVQGGRSINDAIDLETIPVTLIHAWDRRNQEMFTMVEGFTADTVFGPKKWEFLSDGFPQFDLSFNEIPQTDEKSNSYPLSDVTPMLPQLKNLSKIDALMIRHGKRQGGVVLGEQGGISDTQASNIQNSNDLDYITVDNVDKLKTFNFPPVPNSWFNLKGDILQDLFRISGMKQLLASARGVDTATESENIREGGRIRQSGKIDVIEDFTVDIARFLAGTIWQFIDRAQISEILGEEVSEEMWPALPQLPDGSVDLLEARRIIQKEIFFRIDAGSTRPPKDEAVEQKQFFDSMQVLTAAFPGRFKDSVLVEEALKKLKIPEAEKAVIGFDDEEIQVAQRENELLLNGQEIPVSPNENHELHLKVHVQIEQNATTQPTQQYDQHVNEHAAFFERTNVQSSGKNTPGKRKQAGVTEFADIVGSTKVRQPGANTGGRGNV